MGIDGFYRIVNGGKGIIEYRTAKGGDGAMEHIKADCFYAACIAVNEFARDLANRTGICPQVVVIAAAHRDNNLFAIICPYMEAVTGRTGAGIENFETVEISLQGHAVNLGHTLIHFRLNRVDIGGRVSAVLRLHGQIADTLQVVIDFA